MASTMASTSATRSPSGFASLLRRSKFASYDPAIGQVYTAPHAHRVRGTFGFKRQLPHGPKGLKLQYVNMNAPDTAWNVMFWSSGERGARWMNTMDELRPPFLPANDGIDSTRDGWNTWMDQTRPKDRQTWYDDTEFTKALKAGHSQGRGSKALDLDPLDGVLPTRKQDNEVFPSTNWHRLGRKEMRKFLQDVRGLSEDFKAWIVQKHREGSLNLLDENMKADRASKNSKAVLLDNDVVFFELMHAPNAPLLFFEFLKERRSPDWTEQLIPAPHPTAGLSYHRPSTLQAFLDHPPINGHILGERQTGGRGRKRDTADNSVLVGVAGHVAKLEEFEQGSRAKAMQKLSDDPELGRGQFRIWNTVLITPPETSASKRGSLKWEDIRGSRVSIELREMIPGVDALENKSLPGSPKYVSESLSDLRVRGMTGQLRPATNKEKITSSFSLKEPSGSQLVDTLDRLLDKTATTPRTG
ncbi:hypothetical protein DACRYDRAFT_23088 [Dacryopinax primogenitus]|uniref:Uncharacterized protein n=1 Tax=Dacryopinax primogenitus (strain DJM 731) TaxID=1858805 RepID=M5FY59_DACPD|nr:uncharacterized protein DACRYDRAFT_23088 [Dacryopinax primogenitus]EJU00735.1 hypothetical protein DACRYDRAFT_23088 [Dacryopinax primogenitus]